MKKFIEQGELLIWLEKEANVIEKVSTEEHIKGTRYEKLYTDIAIGLRSALTHALGMETIDEPVLCTSCNTLLQGIVYAATCQTCIEKEALMAADETMN